MTERLHWVVGSYGRFKKKLPRLSPRYGVPALGSKPYRCAVRYLADRWGLRELREMCESLRIRLKSAGCGDHSYWGATAPVIPEKRVPTFSSVFIPLHMAPYINKNVWRVYWHHFKFIDILDSIKKFDTSIFFEGDWERFYPYNTRDIRNLIRSLPLPWNTVIWKTKIQSGEKSVVSGLLSVSYRLQL